MTGVFSCECVVLVALVLVGMAAANAGPWWAPQPSSDDFDAFHALEAADMVPWPHGFNQPLPRRNLTPAELRALGQKFFANVSSLVNATVLAEVIYTWTQPTYRQFQFPLTARPQNDTVLGKLITFLPLSSNPWVGQMFNITATTTAGALAQLANQSDQIWANAAAEIGILQFALSQLPSQPYSDPNAPGVLYRGGGRNALWFCNQFGFDFDLSVDECVAAYFAPSSKLSVATFWSTTTDSSVTNKYKGSILYYILPNPQRSAWHVRNITQINVDTSALEHLYPAYSTFVVSNVTCVGKAPFGFWNVTLIEAGPGSPSGRSKPAGTLPFRRCTA